MQTVVPVEPHAGNEASKSGVSWAAIIAGAVVTSALTVMLLAFGAGVGFASVSPWHGEGASAKGATLMAAVWLIVVQWVSSGMGGYLTGRLRCKWVGIHDHEVFFRDTAHGFLSWALATVIGLGVISAGASHMIGAGAHMAEHMSSQHAAGAQQPGMPSNRNLDPLAYYVDTLFRTGKPDTNLGDQDMRAESERILVTSIKNGSMSNADQDYLTKVVQARTGISQPDAEKRVTDVIEQEKQDEAQAQQMADDARKAASGFAVYAFLSMLIGAFIASTAAALGGDHRDKGWGYTIQ